ncbi:hypothetical protein, partial [Sporolactobacillus sp. KGMB 08714]|uniref:hypothetical protein n=1 Tax=Sporolactobacillus sp. KGMB 08714 TaxID=3064704 RepID=UPI002FBD9979
MYHRKPRLTAVNFSVKIYNAVFENNSFLECSLKTEQKPSAIEKGPTLQSIQTAEESNTETTDLRIRSKRYFMESLILA